MPTPTDDTALLNAEIIAREDMTSELCVIKVKPDAGQVAPFKPGQYATLGALPDPDSASRRRRRGSPSCCSAPIQRRQQPATTSSHLEFYLALVHDGLCTPKLWATAAWETAFS